MRIITLFALFISSITTVHSSNSGLNVLSYHVTIEPDIQAKYIKGTVVITFSLPLNETSFELNSGNLQIDGITGRAVEKYAKSEDKLIISLSTQRKSTEEITIHYHGNPTKGLVFNPENNEVYTVYFTHNWMVCNDAPSDKAKINLNIIAPKELNCIATGQLKSVDEKGEKSIFHWSQNFETPSYTYGFVIGAFQEQILTSNNIEIKNYASNYSSNELAQIFKETPDIISFFEEKSGIKYDQPTYSQILVGDHYQEMSGLSILKKSYGQWVLKDGTETNLISHELAHQWWGNRITCESWNHLWLNEAIATYMSAAYNEYRFGKDKYDKDIASYFNVYNDIKRRGKDKSLIFEDWSNPSKDDRNIVYFKGAYVLHLLRQEIGDETFWDCIKNYSQQYFDKTVTTADFRTIIENISGKNMDRFFNEWIY
ncbi:MAG: M1 family metallopeptidase [Cyclobacteriaceae bacterium]|nr:M1 family metallopeptidase [Cyclobacteriaceae bacterium]